MFSTRLLFIVLFGLVGNVLSFSALRCNSLFAKKPVILLDVDGVINTENPYFYNGEWGDVVETEANITTRTWEVFYSPQVVNKINAWSKIADVRWLTTWDESAKLNLAPALGLNDFAMARLGSEKFTKTDVVKRTVDEIGSDGLLIWLEDCLKDYMPESLRTRPNSVFIAPKWALDREQCQLVDSVLADPSFSRGKCITHFDGVLQEMVIPE